MPGKNKLEFAVVLDKARQLHNPETRKYIEGLFRVEVKIPLPHQEEVQWITVHGPNARCKLAKVRSILREHQHSIYYTLSFINIIGIHYSTL